MIKKTIEKISKADIDELIANGVREGREIEYKLLLPGSTDDDKREYLADVSSFANTDGGDLLFGVRAEDGVPVEAGGVAVTSSDAEQLRLLNILRDGIQPRLLGVTVHCISGFNGREVVLVRILKSWNPPHMVTFKGASRFYTRSGAGKYQMDVGEIRSAFAHSEQIPERIRHFRDERIGRLIAGDSPIGKPQGAIMVLHVLPLVSFSRDFTVNLERARLGTNVFLSPLGGGGFNMRFNLDGLLGYCSPGGHGDNEIWTYCQLFRRGEIEAAEDNFTTPGAPDFPQTIPSVSYEERAIRSLAIYMKVLQALDVPAPVVVLLSMIGVKGARMGAGPRYRHGAPIDRDVLLLPDVSLDDYGKPPDQILKPIFDAVWNAAGYPSSLNYGDGQWSPNRT